MKKVLATLATICITNILLSQDRASENFDFYKRGYNTTLSLETKNNYRNVYLEDQFESQILTSIHMKGVYDMYHQLADVNKDGYVDIIISYRTDEAAYSEIFENNHHQEKFSWKHYSTKQLINPSTKQF